MATINKINVGGTDYDVKGSLLYGVCETAANVAAKTVTVDGTFTLYEGVTVAVKFKNTNTATSNFTLNVNNTGAKSCSELSGIKSSKVYSFIYDGTSWNVIRELQDDPYKLGGGAPMALGGYLYSVSDDALIDSRNVAYSKAYLTTTGTEECLLHNVKIAPDSREFCFVNVTFTKSGSTMIGTGTIKGLTNYYPGLTITAYLSNFTYTNSITLNLNSLGSKNVKGLDKSIVSGHVVLLTYTQAGRWIAVKAQASTDEKVKQYNIKVENDLQNGEVAWTGNFPLLTLYNRDSSTFTGETAYASTYYIDPLTNGLVVPRLTTDALNAPEATSQNRGLMSATDKAKLDILPTLKDGKIPNNYMHIYIQDTEPDTSTPTGTIWIDTSVSSVTYAEGVAF